MEHFFTWSSTLSYHCTNSLPHILYLNYIVTSIIIINYYVFIYMKVNRFWSTLFQLVVEELRKTTQVIVINIIIFYWRKRNNMIGSRVFLDWLLFFLVEICFVFLQFFHLHHWTFFHLDSEQIASNCIPLRISNQNAVAIIIFFIIWHQYMVALRQRL